MIRAVLDANVFVSAALRPEGPPGLIFERLLKDDAFKLVLSPAIIEEVARVFAYPKVRRYLRAGIDAEAWLEDLALVADFAEDPEMPRQGISRDADDDKYLLVALAGRATVLVSGDDDLLSLGSYEGIRIITPTEFLAVLDI